jgi:hypothetical protein
MSSSPIHKASLVESSTHSPALLELVDQKMTRPIVGKWLGSVPVAWHFPKTLSQNISSMRSSRLSILFSVAPHILVGADLLQDIQKALPSLPWSTMSLHGQKLKFQWFWPPLSISTGPSPICTLPSRSGPMNEYSWALSSSQAK